MFNGSKSILCVYVQISIACFIHFFTYIMDVGTLYLLKVLWMVLEKHWQRSGRNGSPQRKLSLDAVPALMSYTSGKEPGHPNKAE